MNRVTLFHPALAFTMVVIAIIISACNQPYSQLPSVTNTPVDPNSLFATPIGQTPSSGVVEVFGTGTALAMTESALAGGTPIPGMPAAGSGPSSVQEQLAAIDALNQTLMGNTVFNPPDEIQLHQRKKIQLLLHPYLPEKELKEQLADSGPAPISQRVQVSPEMKAELLLSDDTAFSVQALHDSEIQLISGTETTEWSWFITATKPGSHLVTVVLYRLVIYENQAYWRKVAEYPADIKVKATFLERLEVVNWGWFAGLIVALLVVSAIWLLSYQRAQKQAQDEKSHPRRNERSPNLAAQDPMSRSPKISKVDSLRNQNLGQIFISYRRSDSADITGRIYDRLVDEYGRSPIFKDVDSIPLGTDFKEYLDRKVGECNVLLAIVGDRWVEARDAAQKKRLDDPSDFVRVEIESALQRAIPVIPLLVRGAQMPVEEDLPISLRALVHKNGIQIRPDPDFHNDMNRLISALNKYI